MNYEYHDPVLLKESIDALVTNPDGTYVDVTFGGGGHTKYILSKLSPNGKLIAFDRDQDAQERIPNDSRITFIQHNFQFAKQFLEYTDNIPVDGILGDLGISSHQIDVDVRGFAHRLAGPLDMRMDVNAKLSAETVVNDYNEAQLLNIFNNYGEIKNAYKLTKTILDQRKGRRIQAIELFKEAIDSCTPKDTPAKYLSQVFQAIRIEVNGELRALEQLLIDSESLIKESGRLVIISYHSLEDRLVKNYLNSGNLEGKKHTDMYGWSSQPFESKPNKAIIPTDEEISRNKRARSAKMRIGIRQAWK
jgi:16S rRNA (cytosine1402-N4)-methyltransferase